MFTLLFPSSLYIKIHTVHTELIDESVISELDLPLFLHISLCVWGCVCVCVCVYVAQ